MFFTVGSMPKYNERKVHGVQMIPIQQTLRSFARQNKYKFRFARSRLGDKLRILSEIPSLSNNFQSRLNCYIDYPVFPLLLGYIPESMMVDEGFFKLSQ